MLSQFASERAVIVNLAIEGDRDASVGRKLGLNGVFGIDDAQAMRAHRAVGARQENRVGDIAAVKDPANEPPNHRFAIRPIDRYRDSAHCIVPSEISQTRSPRPRRRLLPPRSRPRLTIL
ncbi:MAG TPA: hypothetical protein VK522_14790 [Pseudolabrys sp.]|nr:hypothetical protein [Pseudolabrys sp.]